MARMITSGIDQFEKELIKMQGDINPLVDVMVMQGAEEMKKARIDAIKKYGHIETGAMIQSVGYAKKPKRVGSAVSIAVYAQGKDKKGVRNAEKEYLSHYGKSKSEGTHWVDEADQKGGEAAFEKMESTMNTFIATGELPKKRR